MFSVNKNPTVTDVRKFGWAMLAGFGVIGLVLWAGPWVRSGDVAALRWSGSGLQIAALCLVVLGLGLRLLCWSALGVAKRVYVAWMTVVTPIGVVMSMLLLTLLFVAMLPIFSLIVRLGDPLRKRLSDDDSYWEDYKPHDATLERMQKPF